MNIYYLNSVLMMCLIFQHAQGLCERSPQMLAAEDICWTKTIKVVDRIQYTTKSILNFAKDKLGLGNEEQPHPAQCDYYECVFQELKMLNNEGYPNYDKMVTWIDNNVIYNHAKLQYDQLMLCKKSLTQNIESNTYFSGDLKPLIEPTDLQDKCNISEEFMKCLALNSTDCLVFKYP